MGPQEPDERPDETNFLFGPPPSPEEIPVLSPGLTQLREGEKKVIAVIRELGCSGSDEKQPIIV